MAALVGAVALLLPVLALASVTATVDRGDVRINESFTLKVEIGGDLSGEPDLTVLEEDFDVLSENRTSSTTIVNGQVSRSRTWTVSLMAKRTGELTVPAFTVDGESSEPITITVEELEEVPPGEADIFLVAEVDSRETWVQAQVIYSVKIFVGVSSRQPRLVQPSFDGVEVLVQPFDDDRRYDSVIGGRTYTVLERRYALFPQASGTLEIGPARFEARLLDQGMRTVRKVFTSEAVTVDVQPIPPPPASHPDAAWLPAIEVDLDDEWEPSRGPVTAGEPVARRIELRATGLLANQLPALDLPVPDGVRSYSDQPELETLGVDDGVLGVRRESFALVASEAGSVEFEALEVPWWDVRAGEWKIATLPPRVLEVLPGAAAEPPAPPPEMPAAMQPRTPAAAGEGFWYRMSLILAGGWVLTLIGWWYSHRTRRVRRVPREAPRFRQEARRLKAVKEACNRGDSGAAIGALLAWGAVRWPDSPPRSLGELAERLPSEAAEEIEFLNRSRYGGSASTWDGRALGRQLEAMTRGGRRRGASEADEVLDHLA
ncbi:BatD family protein [Lentisalinibacter orientalis]|uniref:BatD family protein n=1 Tax=Lentisalinibacter orientalis TaxID=2992241 RepID=UPI00386BBA83